MHVVESVGLVLLFVVGGELKKRRTQLTFGMSLKDGSFQEGPNPGGCCKLRNRNKRLGYCLSTPSEYPFLVDDLTLSSAPDR